MAGAGLLALATLAVTAPRGGISIAAAGHGPVGSVDVKQRQIGSGGLSRKTTVNLRDLAAAQSRTTKPHRAQPTAGNTSRATAAVPVSTSVTAAIQDNAAASFTATVDVKFDGAATDGLVDPPDPNAAAGLTQIVEVVNTRMTIFNRDKTLACGTENPVDLRAFFGSPTGEDLTDPRVIYDNVANRFTVIVTVDKLAPAGPSPVPLIRIAHSLTGDACGNWSKYYLFNEGIDLGTFIDQPSIGQDRNAFLFGGLNAAGTSIVKWVAFSWSKGCAYGGSSDCAFPIFTTGHYATPASAGGNPMIATTSSYFVASVPNVGYELYRMDNSGNTSQTTLTLQATVAAAIEVRPLTRNANQPDTASSINLLAGRPGGLDNRITSTPTFDGTRVWYAHTTSIKNYPVVRYGSINATNNTVDSAVAVHSPTSDDFNPSIAVGISGTSRNIFLNWAYTDASAGLPVTDTVAEVRIGAADPVPVINGKDIMLIRGGITNESTFGDYSSVSIDPVNVGQVCAVTAQEYFSTGHGVWATYISRFGAAGC